MFYGMDYILLIFNTDRYPVRGIKSGF